MVRSVIKWSDKSCIELLMLLKKMLPEDSILSTNYYEAKKILSPMGMEYQKKYAFLNDCTSYKNEFAEIRKCPACGVSRYKVKVDDYSNDESTNRDGPTKVC